MFVLISFIVFLQSYFGNAIDDTARRIGFLYPGTLKFIMNLSLIIMVGYILSQLRKKLSHSFRLGAGTAIVIFIPYAIFVTLVTVTIFSKVRLF